MTEETHYLNTRQAAAWLGLSTKTLAHYRVSGEGPVFHWFGNRIRYLRADLEAWAPARLDRGRRHLPCGSSAMRGTANGRRRPACWVRTRLTTAGMAVTAVAGAVLAGVDVALAASDTTFAGSLDTVTDMVSGTGGRLAAALAVGAALVGSVLRFNAMQLLGAVSAGQRIGLGPVFGADAETGNRAEAAREAWQEEAEREAQRLADWLKGESGPERQHGLNSRTVTQRQLLLSPEADACAHDGPLRGRKLTGTLYAARYWFLRYFRSPSATLMVPRSGVSSSCFAGLSPLEVLV